VATASASIPFPPCLQRGHTIKGRNNLCSAGFVGNLSWRPDVQEHDIEGFVTR
jgi:hypothetical protein